MPSKVPDAKVEQLALAVARGCSLASAARDASVPITTARRWADDPEFPRMVSRFRDQVITQAVGILAKLLTKASVKLGKLIDDPDSEVSLKACRAVNADFQTLHSYADLSRRLDDLEQSPDDDPG